MSLIYDLRFTIYAMKGEAASIVSFEDEKDSGNAFGDAQHFAEICAAAETVEKRQSLLTVRAALAMAATARKS